MIRGKMKVFISSVIEGFEAERNKAKEAVVALNMEPVMAEAFGAKPHSPRKACLDGVRKSEVYLGLLGQRYGYIAPSGKSVTEEEFCEAERIGLPILWLVQNCTCDKQQEDFLKRIKGYESGYFIDFFNSPEELLTKVVKSLNELRHEQDSNVLDIDTARAYRDRLIDELKDVRNPGTSIGAIIFPSNEAETVLSATELEDIEIRESLEKAALFGNTALFSRQLGITSYDGKDYLQLAQGKHHDEASTLLRFYTSGAIVWRSDCSSEGKGDTEGFLFYSYIIDEVEISAKLNSFLAYVKKYYGELLKHGTFRTFYISVYICDLANKKLGKRPARPVSSISIPMSSLHDPLTIPLNPMKISWKNLCDSLNLLKEIMAQIIRAFKAEGLYFNN
jgi:hypothetical protein